MSSAPPNVDVPQQPGCAGTANGLRSSFASTLYSPTTAPLSLMALPTARFPPGAGEKIVVSGGYVTALCAYVPVETPEAFIPSRSAFGYGCGPTNVTVPSTW